MIEEVGFKESYWIMCPYTSNDYMARVMNSDGFVLHTDVKNERGVKAAVRIKN